MRRSSLDRTGARASAFDSPVYIGLFVKQMSQLALDARVGISEMLPTVDDTWLVDANGARYTCEMRLVLRRA